jgi:hypothetical protein
MDNLTPEMKLAMQSDNKRVKSLFVDLLLQAQQLTKKDIASWRAAWQMALNIETPNRVRLYDVYTDVDIDSHLSGCISQRKNMVLQKAFKIVDKNGKEKRELTELLENEWFKQFMSHTLDSIYWGHSLIQFGDIVSTAGRLRFDNTQLVPRRHVIPEYGVIVREAGDEPKKGISYRESKLALWCIEVGMPNNLGLFLKVAPHALAKKNMIAFWDQFGELFGMPIRIGKTTSREPGERKKIEDMLANMGGSAWALFTEGTEIEIKETQRGDAFQVYDKRIDRANSEMSKAILNQTMTIENGSSLSQSETHLEVFKNLIWADADMVRDVANNKLIPFLNIHGFNFGDVRFEWDEIIEYTPEQQIRIEQMILNDYDIDPIYFQEKYNIPVLGKKEKQSFFD